MAQRPNEKPPPAGAKASLDGHESYVENREASPSVQRNPVQNLNAKLANPLSGLSHDRLMADAATFAKAHGLAEYTEVLQKGALVAQDPAAFETIPMLDDNDRNVLRREFTHKWDQPATLYYLVIMCSIAAAVQGVSKYALLICQGCIYSCEITQMDEAVINGANLFFASQFGIDPGNGPGSGSSKNQWLLGLVISAPYVRSISSQCPSNVTLKLCCGLIGCWITDPVRPSSFHYPCSVRQPHSV